MAMTWDLTDVPSVDAADLHLAMRALIEAGHGLVLLNGASEGDLDTVRTVLHDRHKAEPQRALAAFVRFRNLVDVFATRRLRDVMLGTGYAVLAPALAVAAAQRINARRGFNPQRFLVALQAALADDVAAETNHHSDVRSADGPLAA